MKLSYDLNGKRKNQVDKKQRLMEAIWIRDRNKPKTNLLHDSILRQHHFSTGIVNEQEDWKDINDLHLHDLVDAHVVKSKNGIVEVFLFIKNKKITLHFNGKAPENEVIHVRIMEMCGKKEHGNVEITRVALA